MEFITSTTSDIPRIMDIIGQAQEYLKKNEIPQWQNGYPNQDTIQQDINQGYSYVLVEGSEILATLALSFDGETSYDKIYEGEWRSKGDYGVIHRIAVDSNHKGRGIASAMIEFVKVISMARGVHSIRVDTHRQNHSMQRLLEKNGFQYSGTIYLADGAERIAFELLL